MLSKIILSVVVGVVTTLACLLLAALLVAMKVDVAVAIGDFLRSFAGVIGIVAGVWYYIVGSPQPRI